jgi:hypothetical protein
MFRLLNLGFKLLKLACILVLLYLFFLLNLVSGGGALLALVAIFFVGKFILAAGKK